MLSSSTVFFTSTLKLHKGSFMIKQLDKYRKHCFWRGSDLSSKKPSKEVWLLVCLPKKQGGLGVINLTTHNDALLLKFLHKFFSKVDIPWVHLLWENHYGNNQLPGQKKKESFWWKDIIKLLDAYKGIASATVSDGTTVLFWKDLWNGQVPSQAFPELYSFAINKCITVNQATNALNFIQNFHLPLSIQAHQQYQMVCGLIQNLPHTGGNDQWSYLWGSNQFSASKAYKSIIGQRNVHPAFSWIWKSKCQMKHKVFF